MIRIGGLQKLTLIDYPGHLAATVFLCGCNFRCPWCYNPELVLKISEKPDRPRFARHYLPTDSPFFKEAGSSRQNSYLVQPFSSKSKGLSEFPLEIPRRDFFNFLKERRELLEGVCISGGESTIYKDLPKFCQKIKKLGYLVKLDTNGSNPEILEHLIKNNLVDYIAMDVKAPLNQKKYNQLAGAKTDLDKIKKSIKIIKNSKIDYQFRTTFVPQLLTKSDILEIKKYLGKAKYIVQPYFENLEYRKQKVE